MFDVDDFITIFLCCRMNLHFVIVRSYQTFSSFKNEQSRQSYFYYYVSILHFTMLFYVILHVLKASGYFLTADLKYIIIIIIVLIM